MMTVDQMIEVLQAFKAGKKIEYKSHDDCYSEWSPVTIPCWAFDRGNYRVKPEPREYIILLDKDGAVLGAEAGSLGAGRLMEVKHWGKTSSVTAIQVVEKL